MRATRMPVLILALLAFAATPAVAQVQLPAQPQTASLDSDAPPGSPPHWLPGEQWVMQHWLPYDEQRLYSLLGVDRGVIWRYLRDDTRNLAQLAQERGWEPAELARELVAPWRGQLRDPDRLALLEQRALRTLTQGHLSQHLFFHSLHQEAIPTHATRIFGVASRAEWSTLRRSELSPLQICRLNGLPRGHAQEQAAATLRAYADKGVARQSIPAAQAERLLSRQLRQLPRWLQQTRYNGPPPLHTPRSSPATASNYSNNAALSGDGREVVFESYQAKLAVAKRVGEIAVMARAVGAASPPAVASGETADPRSNYNPALSADGRWVAFESALGNLNFAKRYGRMEVLARDLRSGRTIRVSHPPELTISRSAYNPTISGDGRLIAYEAYDRPDEPGGHTRVVVRDVRSGREQAVPAPPGMADELYEPRLSADGRRLAFSALTRGSGVRSEVFVRDLRSGRTVRVSGAGEEAWEPVLSARRDGRRLHRRGCRRRVARRRPRPRARARHRDRLTGRRGPRVRAVAVEQRAPRRVRGAARRHAPDAGLRPRPARAPHPTRLPRRRPRRAARHGEREPPGDLRRRPSRRLHLRGLEPVAAEVQQRARDLRARPRRRDHAAGERGRRRQPLHRPDQGVQHPERCVHHPPLRVIATPPDPG